MANQHTAELERRAAELAAEIYPLQTRAEEIQAIIRNPQCGKPGKGYKAAKRLWREYTPLMERVNAIRMEIGGFIRANKAGPETRKQREMAFVRAYEQLKHSPDR